MITAAVPDAGNLLQWRQPEEWLCRRHEVVARERQERIAVEREDFDRRHWTGALKTFVITRSYSMCCRPSLPGTPMGPPMAETTIAVSCRSAGGEVGVAS